MTLMVNKTKKTINLVRAQIGISHEKGAYTLFYWCTLTIQRVHTPLKKHVHVFLGAYSPRGRLGFLHAFNQNK